MSFNRNVVSRSLVGIVSLALLVILTRSFEKGPRLIFKILTTVRQLYLPCDMEKVRPRFRECSIVIASCFRFCSPRRKLEAAVGRVRLITGTSPQEPKKNVLSRNQEENEVQVCAKG